MKRAILLFGFFFLTISAYGQNTLIVDNTGSAPTGDHIYTNLQAAIDAAQAGDVIQVVPSPNIYGNGIFDINTEGLTLIGSGYLPENGHTSTLGNITIQGDNIRISGIVFSEGAELKIDSEDADDKATDIVIENTEIHRLQVFNASNVVFNSCFINKESVSAVSPDIHSSSNGITITNSIILARFDNFANTEISNSIWSAIPEGNNFSTKLEGNTFLNNILLGAYPSTTSSLSSNENNNFRFNYSSSIIAIGENGNTGSDNIVNEGVTDVLESDGTNWLNEFNPNLPTGSSLIGAASDGGDLGVFGGLNPYSRTGQSLPAITEFIAPLSIKIGTDTEVTIKAKGN